MEENRSLKINLEQVSSQSQSQSQNSRTIASFYDNNSTLSLQLRKTLSTDLELTSPKLAPLKKLERRATTTNNNINSNSNSNSNPNTNTNTNNMVFTKNSINTPK